MSRSRRKTPVCSMTVSGFRRGEKKDKRLSNRKVRQKVKMALQRREEHPPYDHRDGIDVWSMDKDGKSRFDPRKHPELMRK